MINVTDTAQKLSDDYAALGSWIGLATDDPGSTSAPANEALGSGYGRKQTQWTSGSGGVNQGMQVTINAAAGEYTHMILCSDSTGDNMIDNCELGPHAILNTDGEVLVTPTYTQS